MTPAPFLQPTTAAELPAEWLHLIRDIVVRDGHALRASALPGIEAQSINSPENWHPLARDGQPLRFTTPAERDLVLAMLTGERPLPPLPPPADIGVPDARDLKP